MSEQVGKHKGAVETLLHEKKELSRLLSIVNGQLERHINALEEEGVDTDQFINELQQSQQRQQQARQEQQRQQQQKQQKQESSRRQRSRGQERQQSSNKGRQEDEKDVDDMLESEDRDFNPL